MKISPHGGYREKHTWKKHAHTKAVLNRLARAAGHLNAVKKMVEDGRDCSDVLIQLAAVRAELTATGKVILQDHFDHCIVQAVQKQDEQAIAQLRAAIEKLL